MRHLLAAVSAVAAALLLLLDPTWLEGFGLGWLLDLLGEDDPEQGPGLLDKIGHALLFASVSWTWARSLELALRRWALVLAAIAAFLYGTGLELAQRALPGRSYEPWDLVANGSGIAIAILILARLRQREREP
jgi:VanZ family protein